MSYDTCRVPFGHLRCCSLPSGTSLVQVLIQLGPEITSDPEVVRALLMRFNISDANPPRDSLVVEIMSTLGRLAAEGTTMCDVGALVRALSSFVRFV
jgi:CCR4-NOT transcription complex subunit 1